MTVKATLKIRDAKGRLVKTVKLGTVAAFAPGLGRPQSAPLAKVKWSLPKGTYMVALCARDASGHKQSRLGKAKVTVK